MCSVRMNAYVYYKVKWIYCHEESDLGISGDLKPTFISKLNQMISSVCVQLIYQGLSASTSVNFKRVLLK